MKMPNLIRITLLNCCLLLSWSALCSHAQAAPGEVDLSFDPGSGVNGSVTAVRVQPDGKVIIAGAFTAVKGLLRTNLARLHADGSGDATFDAGARAEGLIAAVALQADGKLLVGGTFPHTWCDESGCVPDQATLVRRLNADGSSDSTFAEALTDYSFVPREHLSLVPLADGRILVGGDFNSIHGTMRAGIARLNADGTVDASFHAAPGLSGAVQGIVVQPDGKILISGNFVWAGSAPRTGITRLNASGSLDTTFDAGFVAVQPVDCAPPANCYEYTQVTALAVQPDGRVLAGVWKRLYQSDPGDLIVSDRYLVMRFNANGSSDPGFVFTDSARTRRVGGLIVQPDGRVLMRHGEFNTSRIARLHGNGSWDDSFQPGNTSGGANAAALQPDGKVIIGGTSVSVDAGNGQRLSRLNADGSRDTTFNPGKGLESAVPQIALQPDGKVLLGGPLVVGDPYFGPVSDVPAFVNGTNRHGRARLNGDGSLDGGFITSPFHPPLEARYHTGDCLGDPRFGCLHGFTSSALLVQADGKVLLAGTFITTIYGDELFYQTHHSFLGRFTATGGLETEFNLPDVYISTMAQQPDGKIVIGGNLTFSGTNSTVARLHADGSVDGSFQRGQGPASVIRLALQSDGKLVVAGAGTIVRLHNNGSSDPAFAPVTLANGEAHTLALQSGGKVLVGGSFTSVAGTVRQRIARLNSDGTLDTSFDPGAGPDAAVRSIAVQPDGNILISGDFRTVSGVVRPYVARLFGDPLPVLSIALTNGNARLAWPADGRPVQLQETADFSQPGEWSAVALLPATDGGVTSVTVPLSGTRRFFRLAVP